MNSILEAWWNVPPIITLAIGILLGILLHFGLQEVATWWWHRNHDDEAEWREWFEEQDAEEFKRAMAVMHRWTYPA